MTTTSFSLQFLIIVIVINNKKLLSLKSLPPLLRSKPGKSSLTQRYRRILYCVGERTSNTSQTNAILYCIGERTSNTSQTK